MRHTNFSDWLQDNCEQFNTESGFLDVANAADLDEAFMFLTGETFIGKENDSMEFITEDILNGGNDLWSAHNLLLALRGDTEKLALIRRVYVRGLITNHYMQDLIHWKQEHMKNQALDMIAEGKAA